MSGTMNGMTMGDYQGNTLSAMESADPIMIADSSLSDDPAVGAGGETLGQNMTSGSGFPANSAYNNSSGEIRGVSTAAPGSAASRPQRAGPKVLIAEADPVRRRSMGRRLEAAGYRVIEAENGRQALSQSTSDTIVAILDMQLFDISGIDCMRHLKQQFPDIQVMITVDEDKAPAAVESIRDGAFETLIKPFEADELLIRTRQAVTASRLIRENRALRQAVGTPTPAVRLVGNSQQMQTVRKQIEAFSRLDSPVMITGPMGVGKSTVAQLIHRNSSRRQAPFIVVNCQTTPREMIASELFGYVRGVYPDSTSDRPGRIEVAHGGTLFIDEIAELPLELQDRLLQFLQERTVRRMGATVVHEVNARVIVSTSRDLTSLCRDGRFREELFMRLNVLSIHIPGLNERQQDIPVLASETIERVGRRLGLPVPVLSEDALIAMRQHPWPGNSREMEQVLERAMHSMSGGTVYERDLTFDRFLAGGNSADSFLGLAGMSMAEIERRAIIETIRACGGNRAKSARKLGVSEKTIYNKIRQFKLRGIV